MTEDKRFLNRWSQRKRAARIQTKEPSSVASAGLEPASPPLEKTLENTDAVDPNTLPDIDSLDESSDFSVFLQNGVPETLRNRALRKLWQTDPAFNFVDGLVEYGEDYTNIATIAESVQTAYKVGKGMVDEAEESATDIRDRDASPVESATSTPGRPTAIDDGRENDMETGDNAESQGENLSAIEEKKTEA
jgi:hypothetical protein